MDAFNICCKAELIALCLLAGQARGDERDTDSSHTIVGIVMDIRSGTPDVPVCLCDAETGMPLEEETYNPIAWDKTQPLDAAKKMAIIVADKKGGFRFENVREGSYRIVAQKWIGPYKGVFETHGTVIQLMGFADNVVVPRPTDNSKARVVLTPPGEGIIEFDQRVPNNETFMFLSTSPPEFDPILGLHAMGSSFFRGLIGVNRMPYGKTTVIGSPNETMYAFLFAADNSPGFATIRVPPSRSGLVRVPPEPFVAGWSNGRKNSPPKLAELSEFLHAHSLSVSELLNIPQPNKARPGGHQARMQELTQHLSQKVELPEGRSARVGDLLSVERYRQLNN